MLPSGIAHQQDVGLAPVVARAFDRGPGAEAPRHCHPTAQLLYAVKGVMLVETDAGQWIVPPTRGIWVPIGVWHRTVMLGEVLMRTVYIVPRSWRGYRPSAAWSASRPCCAN